MDDDFEFAKKPRKLTKEEIEKIRSLPKNERFAAAAQLAYGASMKYVSPDFAKKFRESQKEAYKMIVLNEALNPNGSARINEAMASFMMQARTKRYLAGFPVDVEAVNARAEAVRKGSPEELRFKILSATANKANLDISKGRNGDEMRKLLVEKAYGQRAKNRLEAEGLRSNAKKSKR